MADDSVKDSIPLVAVTAAVGAVVLLLVLLCNMGKKADPEEEEGKLSAWVLSVWSQHRDGR